MSDPSATGKLILVPTPIGNLGDMTIRGIETLKSVDLILAEDTRTAGKLLKHYEISTQLQPHHAFNEHRSSNQLIAKLKGGMTIALISDAGTPGISDPGFLIVRACREEQIQVECLPGATAFVPALVASGIPCNTFHFEGFLPHKKGRQTRLKYLCELPHTFAIYESPFRLLKCLEQLILHCGEDRISSVCREISKIFESHQYGTLQENLKYYQEHTSQVKGEIVIIVQGKDPKS